MRIIVACVVVLACAAPAEGHLVGERRSLSGLISSSDLIVFAQAEDATAPFNIKNLGRVSVTRIKVFQSLKGRAPSRYLMFAGEENPPARYGRGAGAVIFLKKVPERSPLSRVCLYVNLQTAVERILLSGENDLAVIDAVRKIARTLEIRDFPSRREALRDVLLNLVNSPDIRIRRDAAADLTGLALSSGPPRGFFSRTNIDYLVSTALSSDGDPVTRQEIILLIGRLKDAGALLTLLPIQPDSMRASVIALLGDCRDERAVDPLMDIIKNDRPEAARAAVFAVARIGGPRALGHLRELTRSGRKDVSRWAGEALKNAGS